MASTSANERAEQTAHLTQKRGETVVLVFSMQGWGNVINTIVILALLAMYGQYGSKTPLVYGANVVGAGIPNGTISAVLPINSTVAATANTNATSAKLAGSYTLSTSILSNNTATITPPGSTFQIVQGGATASGGGYFYVSPREKMRVNAATHCMLCCFLSTPDFCRGLPTYPTGPPRTVCCVAYLLLHWPDPHPLHALLAYLCEQNSNSASWLQYWIAALLASLTWLLPVLPNQVLRESAVFLAKRASLRELGETQKYNNKKNMLLLK